jgi:hypothetical protein
MQKHSNSSKTSEQPNQDGAAIVVRSTMVDRDRFPDLGTVESVILKDGPRVRKEASHAIILNRHTGEFHHDAVSIKTFRKQKEVWSEDTKHTISLSSEDDDEIQKLLDFLTVVRGGSIPKKGSEYIVVAAPSDASGRSALQKLLNDLSATGKIDVLADVLKQVTQDVDLLPTLLERAAKHPQLFAEAAAALNLATYKNAVIKLQNLINTRTAREAQFQGLLVENPWMFGSEYSELLDRRKWTRDEQQDFVLRKTTDGYIELIEIKTPLGGANLFNYDSSHKSYFAGVDLSKVIGQVQKYLERLDAERNSILANDGEDTCKIRAKIIIGRDSDKDQKEALRRLNGHLYRIEVLTFDQLLRIAKSVLSYLESALRPNPQIDHYNSDAYEW